MKAMKIKKEAPDLGMVGGRRQPGRAPLFKCTLLYNTPWGGAMHGSK